ncbi:TldE/PmbA protein, part of proposed TldE/TldD proteolytic complex (PMID 12029038) [Crocosphaera watsonii WH 8502]|uniref:TldE/PmbA protein, part of proposed TldE/TldD proteolytic complex (PMID 12029038) n=2 Tax=Crocosphaera watsonii TaxID=263511 RepID=T2IFS8_CROWT|nr:TldE/PmbA protein, part of proposed TldE/TldD proteolytic complex (PMID 12029038) [Crocosphaera watsonii WH 8502]
MNNDLPIYPLIKIMTLDPQQLIDLALKAGASHAEVYQCSSQSRPVFFEANRLKQLESSQSQGTALRLWKEGAPGLAVAYGEVDSTTLVERAIALSALNEPETIELNQPRQHIQPTVGEGIAVETLIDMGKEAIAQLRENYPEVLCSGEFASQENFSCLVNSLGLHCQSSEVSTDFYLGVEWVRGEDFLAIYEGEHSRQELAVEKAVEGILQRLAWAKTTVSPKTGRMPVLFTPNGATLLWETVVDALNSKMVLEKASPWSEKLGEKIVSEQLNLSQQPNFEPYSCPFDDEGTITQPLSLIREGRLRQFYSDRTRARLLGTESTGNGFRPSLGSYPSPGLVNLIVEGGDSDFEQLVKQLDKGIIVEQILGGGADISGDFSINIDLGYAVENGVITGRVKDTMVSGNVYQVLQEIIALGNDSRWIDSCFTPSLLVEGLSINN